MTAMQTAQQAIHETQAPSRHVERARPGSLLARYVKAAMRHATCEQVADHQAFRGAITGLPGVSSRAATYDECRAELRAVLETWLLLRLCQNLPIPPVDGVPLVAWIATKKGF